MTIATADSKPGPADPAAPTPTTATTEQAKEEKKTGGRRAPPAEGSRPLDKKRARDRRAQQALRDRTRSTIHNLSEQVTTLTRVVERQSQELSDLRGRLDAALTENTALRRRVASGEAGGPLSQVDIMDISTMMNGGASASSQSAPWNTPPLNSAPTSIADQLFQGFVDVQRQAVAQSPSATTASSSTSPDITPLLDRRRRGTDKVSKVASDVVRTYTELDTLPKQIAVHFLMTHLLKVRFTSSSSRSLRSLANLSSGSSSLTNPAGTASPSGSVQHALNAQSSTRRGSTVSHGRPLVTIWWSTPRSP